MVSAVKWSGPGREYSNPSWAGLSRPGRPGSPASLRARGGGVAPVRGRDQLLGGQRGAHRVEQRAQQRARREAHRLQRHRLQHPGGEQPVRAQFTQHPAEQRGGLAGQHLVGRVMLGDVVAGGRGPVRALHGEAEEGLFLGREEHDQRDTLVAGQAAARGVADPEGDLHALPRVPGGVQVPVPGEPGFPVTGGLAGHGDLTARARAGGHGALGDRRLDSRAAHPDALDAAEEEQGARLELAQRRGDLRRRGRGRNLVVVEREHEHGAGRGLTRAEGRRADVVVDPEALAAAVDPRAAGVGVDRLEPDAELADRGEVGGLGARADPADAAHVGLGERPAVVPHLQAAGEQLERHLGRPGVLRVLDQLEDEVGALAVQPAEQVQHGRVPAVAGDVLVADLLVISWHR